MLGLLASVVAAVSGFCHPCSAAGSSPPGEMAGQMRGAGSRSTNGDGKEGPRASGKRQKVLGDGGNRGEVQSQRGEQKLLKRGLVWKIGLVSDTHGQCDEALKEALQGVDELWHTGDIAGTSAGEESIRSSMFGIILLAVLLDYCFACFQERANACEKHHHPPNVCFHHMVHPTSLSSRRVPLPRPRLRRQDRELGFCTHCSRFARADCPYWCMRAGKYRFFRRRTPRTQGRFRSQCRLRAWCQLPRGAPHPLLRGWILIACECPCLGEWDLD